MELMVRVCRMEYHEEHVILPAVVCGLEEESPETLPVAEQPAGPILGIDIPLGRDLEEGGAAVLPPPAESPSPALSDDGEEFMKIYDRAELLLLKNLREHSWIMREGVGYLVVEPLITERFKTFLQFLNGPQWEANLLRGREKLLAQPGAYVSDCF